MVFLHFEIFIISVNLVKSLLQRAIVIFSVLIIAGCSSYLRTCSDSWRITGYFTPVESDYIYGSSRENEVGHAVLNKYRSNDQAKFETITVAKFGKFQFSKAFLKDVAREGWGKTRFGWYLGRYANRWHRANKPLNALGQALEIGQAAADNTLVQPDSLITINRLAGDLPVNEFVVTDVGSKINGKKIDIYTGEGKIAEQLTYRVTGLHSVCMADNSKFEPKRNVPVESITH